MKRHELYEREFVTKQNREIDNLISLVINVHTNFLKEPKRSTLKSLCQLCFKLGYECARLSIFRSRQMTKEPKKTRSKITKTI